MTVSDYIFKYLSDVGVTHAYYLPGGLSMHLNDALARQDRITPVCCLHEQACAIASSAHNMYTNTLSSVVVTTGGPGGLNAITGVAAAWLDYVPLLVISGQVPTSMMRQDGERQRGPQEVAIGSVVQYLTKGTWVKMYDPKAGPPMDTITERALKHPRGPVWNDLPLDTQGAKI